MTRSRWLKCACMVVAVLCVLLGGGFCFERLSYAADMGREGHDTVTAEGTWVDIHLAGPDETHAQLSESTTGRSEEAPSGPYVEFFSDKGRVFSPIMADPREAQFRMGFMQETRSGDTLWDLVFGGDAGLLNGSTERGDDFSLTVRGLMSARFDFASESFDLLNIDFIGGPALGYRHGNDSFEAFLYHESSHLGDEIMEQGERERIDFSREALRLLWSHQFDGLRLYGGPTVNLRADPGELEGRVTLQLGSEYRFVALGRRMYGALDLQSRQEHDWEPNVSAQVGLDLGDSSKIYRQQRIFLEYFQGFSNMGQFYDERERYVLVGLAFNT